MVKTGTLAAVLQLAVHPPVLVLDHNQGKARLMKQDDADFKLPKSSDYMRLLIAFALIHRWAIVRNSVRAKVL